MLEIIESEILLRMNQTSMNNLGSNSSSFEITTNYKGKLQEFCQKN